MINDPDFEEDPAYLRSLMIISLESGVWSISSQSQGYTLSVLVNVQATANSNRFLVGKMSSFISWCLGVQFPSAGNRIGFFFKGAVR